MQVQKRKDPLLPQISGKKPARVFFLALARGLTSAHFCFREGEDLKLSLSFDESRYFVQLTNLSRGFQAVFHPLLPIRAIMKENSSGLAFCVDNRKIEGEA